MRDIRKLQDYSKEFQKDMNWEIDNTEFERSRSSLLNNYMLLTTEVAEVAEEIRKAFNMTYKNKQNGMNEEDAFLLSKNAVRDNIGNELADCIAYLCKFANFFELDLEDSFYKKMDEIKKRKNKDITLSRS